MIEATKHFMGIHVMLYLPKLWACELSACYWHSTLLTLYRETDLASNTRYTAACYITCLLQIAQMQ